MLLYNSEESKEERKMSKIYDCRAFCTNMYKSSIKKQMPESGYTNDANGYFCGLTNNRCVGTKEGLTIFSDDRLNVEIVERCPSRKTIDSLMESRK